jgi:hypothetical protein
MNLRPATKDEFDAFIASHPLAVPDGFRINGSLTQTNYIERGVVVARRSWDSQGELYDIADQQK